MFSVCLNICRRLWNGGGQPHESILWTKVLIFQGANPILCMGSLSYIIQSLAYARIQEDLARKSEELLKAENKRIELEKQLKQAQLDALQKQVTPHFIFNVINSISRLLSLKEYGTAQEMLSSFSQMLRYSLSDLRSAVPLQQELDYISNYLAIQNIRFGERIHYEITCDEELKSFFIPFFLSSRWWKTLLSMGFSAKSMAESLYLSV